jgi:hypothetical protein
MKKLLVFIFGFLMIFQLTAFAQTNEWMTDYTVFDDAINGTGYQTSSVAAIGPDRFVALVTETPSTDIFDPPGNYLVGYWDADSGMGRVNSPINGSPGQPLYGFTGQFTDWTSGLDLIKFKGAWALASGDDDYVYVANNDANHNILVFELTSNGVVSTDYRMETGNDNIFGIEVDTAGYVYVVTYDANILTTSEVKVYEGIDFPGTSWGNPVGHNDSPITTIDLPDGIYQGITVSDDGTSLFVSATSQRSILKYAGDPVNGYTLDTGFQFTLSPDDTIGNGGSGTPSVLGLGYLNNPPMVFAAVDSFIHIGGSGGYPYGRIYVVDPTTASSLDTIDIAEWNFAITGSYSSGSNNGRAGGFTSVIDVDIEPSEQAVYTQTYYGWAVEKWLFDGNLDDLLSIEQISANVPSDFALKQNYPNPFNPSTTIEFDVKQSGLVTLEIFNVMGQKVAELINEKTGPGTYKAVFDGSGLTTGVYFYKLTAGNFVSVKKMVLTK